MTRKAHKMNKSHDQINNQQQSHMTKKANIKQTKLSFWPLKVVSLSSHIPSKPDFFCRRILLPSPSLQHCETSRYVTFLGVFFLHFRFFGLFLVFFIFFWRFFSDLLL